MGRPIVLDEDEERDLYADYPEHMPDDDAEVDWLEGAAEWYEDAGTDAERRGHAYYSREEVSEYLHELAEAEDFDISELYDMYYGYSDET